MWRFFIRVKQSAGRSPNNTYFYFKKNLEYIYGNSWTKSIENQIVADVYFPPNFGETMVEMEEENQSLKWQNLCPSTTYTALLFAHHQLKDISATFLWYIQCAHFKMADIGAKRSYDYGGEIVDAPGSGQLVAAKRQKNEIEIYNEQQQSLLSVVCIYFDWCDNYIYS